MSWKNAEINRRQVYCRQDTGRGGDVEIFYQGTDITDMVQVNACIVRDTAAGRCDSLEIEFGNAAGWYSWGPEEDDKIIVGHNGYDSGVMYVNKIMPEDGKYRIMAASLPCKARAKGNASFYGQTIEEIVRSCAMVSGMEYQLFGIDGAAVIPYIERENEGCAAFLNRFLMLESAVLKCVNGKYAAIDIKYAQGMEAGQTVELMANQEGSKYRRDGTKYRGVTIKTPYASAYARDAAVGSTHAALTINDLPAMNDIQAGRWARGKLLWLNRQCEKVTVQNSFNAGLTAMARIDVTGDTDATGEWLVEEAEHDFINLTTTAILRRCLWSIQ